MMNFHIKFHHLVDVERFDTAAGGHANGVADKIESVMVFEEFRVLGEYRAFVRRVAIGFESHQAFFAGATEQFEEHFESFEVFGFCIFQTAKGSGESGDKSFENMQRVGDEHGSDGSAEDDDQFGGLDQNPDVSILHQVAGEDGAEDHHDSDNHEHGEDVLGFFMESIVLHRGAISAEHDAFLERLFRAEYHGIDHVVEFRRRAAEGDGHGQGVTPPGDLRSADHVAQALGRGGDLAGGAFVQDGEELIFLPSPQKIGGPQAVLQSLSYDA
jgi:hypothetical protein